MHWIDMSTISRQDEGTGAQPTSAFPQEMDKADFSDSYHELSLSYNGGKDCLVLLILYLAAVGQHIWQIRLLGELDGSNETFVTNSCHGHEVTTKHGIRKIAGPPPPESLASVYIAAPSAFPQLTGFVETSASKYHLQLASYATKPQPPNALSFRQAFVHYLQDRPQTKAILVGTRRTDPNGANLGFFDRTDGKWREEGADFMRVHPVIEWEYDDVWRFLRLVKEVSPEFGWCELYDRGYTSLGGKDDTRPNPQLREEGSGKGAWYRPAWELQDGTAERAGRNWP